MYVSQCRIVLKGPARSERSVTRVSPSVYFYDPSLDGKLDKSCPCADAELFGHVGLVRDDGLGADGEHIADFLMRISLCHEFEDLLFPVSEFLIRIFHRRLSVFP